MPLEANVSVAEFASVFACRSTKPQSTPSKGEHPQNPGKIKDFPQLPLQTAGTNASGGMQVRSGLLQGVGFTLWVLGDGTSKLCQNPAATAPHPAHPLLLCLGCLDAVRIPGNSRQSPAMASTLQKQGSARAARSSSLCSTASPEEPLKETESSRRLRLGFPEGSGGSKHWDLTGELR